MYLIDDGQLIVVKEEQPLKAPSSIVCKLFLKVTLVKEVLYANAYLPMVISVLGVVNLVNAQL